MSDDLARMDATDQAELVRTGKVSPAELVEAAIARIEKVNPELNAIIHPLFDDARKAAADGLPDGPFTGVPMVLKDLICFSAGHPMHEGMRFLKDQDWIEETDQYLAVRALVTECPEHVGGRLERDFPRVVVLRAFLPRDVHRTVVRDSGSHQHEIGIATGERLLEHCLSGGSLDHFDAGRRWHAQVRGEKRHLGAALARLLGQCDAHATGRPVAEKPHGVKRFARSTRADEHPPPRERVGLTEQFAAAPVDLLWLGHPPEPPLPFRRLPFVRADDLRSA